MKPVTNIKNDRQTFVDDPVYSRPKKVDASVAAAFGRKLRPILTGYERVQLRWMKPGPDGKLVPR